MGPLALPTTGLAYVDANVVIYTIEKHPQYGPALRPLWGAVDAGQSRVLVSELILLESLVGPYRANDQQLASDYEAFLKLPGIELIAISAQILREAARLRSQIPRLRPPDAIHAATALSLGATSFLTNDFGFRNVPQLNAIILDDVIGNTPNV
ncbi:MAG: PIN domain-containing protein [Planctomycetota bacterium]|nr:PIN domain-containing protein [Planctomycetota bacterium]